MNKMQRMAAKAIEIIQNKKTKDEIAIKEYKSRMNSFPVMVMQSGLAQASGFYLAKKSTHAEYLSDIASVLQAAGEWSFQDKSFHDKSIQCDAVTYRMLTRDTLAAAGWLKRYGAALL